MRLLVLGMGGHLGTAVAKRFAVDARVEMLGFDIEPPRRLLRNAEFHLVVDPMRERAVESIVARTVEFAPTHIAHFAVYEPHARANPRAAHARTMVFTHALTSALAQLDSVQQIAVRSGIEVYGRQRGAALSPDERVVPEPTTGFGRSMLAVERLVSRTAHERGIAMTALRFAPIAGPHIPSPLTRYLRLPVLVPVGALPDPPFSLLHIDDAADATAIALGRHLDGAVNIVGEGAATAAQAVRIGGRIPVPTIGPGWLFARLAAGAFGCPLPEHVVELFTRGRTADGALARSLLDFVPTHRTLEIVHEMYQWEPVRYLDVISEVAA